jgi:hypothetical protein
MSGLLTIIYLKWIEINNIINYIKMKYIEEYIEKKLRIKILGELKLEEYKDVSDGAIVGVDLVIDGFTPGIQIWYSDYLNWLENYKIPELIET